MYRKMDKNGSEKKNYWRNIDARMQNNNQCVFFCPLCSHLLLAISTSVSNSQKSKSSNFGSKIWTYLEHVCKILPYKIKNQTRIERPFGMQSCFVYRHFRLFGFCDHFCVFLYVTKSGFSGGTREGRQL